MTETDRRLDSIDERLRRLEVRFALALGLLGGVFGANVGILLRILA